MFVLVAKRHRFKSMTKKEIAAIADRALAKAASGKIAARPASAQQKRRYEEIRRREERASTPEQRRA